MEMELEWLSNDNCFKKLITIQIITTNIRSSKENEK